MCCSSTSKILAILMPIFLVFIVYRATSNERVSQQVEAQRKLRTTLETVESTYKEKFAEKIDLAKAERNAIAKSISLAESLQELAKATIADQLEESKVRAEVGDTQEAEALASTNDEPASTGTDLLDNVLSKDAWYDEPPRVDGEVHYIAVPCDVSGSLEESLKTIGESIVREAHRYVEQFVLDDVATHLPENLTEDWIRERWLVPGKVYDKVHILPSGEYHQAIVQFQIPPSDRKLIREWSLDHARTERATQLGFITAGAVGMVGVAHLLLGLFAGRRRSASKVHPLGS